MIINLKGRISRDNASYQESRAVALLVMVLILSVFIVGCSSSEDNELSRYINSVKLRPAKPIEPLPQFTPLPKFVFPENDARRSPFKPKVVDQGVAPNEKRPKQPLEAFPLDALKFVGLLREGSTIWALIQEPDGLVTRVKPGDYMGQNYGLIKNIKEKTIELEEAVQVDGKWEKRKISLNLRTKS